MPNLRAALLVMICATAAADLGCAANVGSDGFGGKGGGGASGTGGAGSGGASAGGDSGSGSGGATAGSGGDNGSGGQAAGDAGSTGGSGGAPVDGAGGGASADGGGDRPVTVGATCDGFTSKFCDDFEKQTSGQAPAGAFKVSSPTILVDGTKPYSGTKSVHIKVAPGGAASELTFSSQFPFNEEHGRLMMFMTRVPTNGSHWDIVHSRNPSTDWEIGGQFGAFEFVADPPDHGVLSKTKVPVGKWFCLQWEFKYGGTGMPNTFVAKMDGTALEQGMFTGPNSRGESWVAGPWRSLNLGWVGYQASNVEMELWIDDLAFGEQEIACPAAL